ncbi:hypothetical protein GA0070619_4090 [Micromonospora zamorensis]|nr:hypothetical protein GA0070619_4090 [Micromonospora zamorensis]
MPFREEPVLVTRTGWILAGVGSVLWVLSPLFWVMGTLPLDASLFIGSTALLPWLTYLATRKRAPGGPQ